jgi:predicted membrane protein
MENFRTNRMRRNRKGCSGVKGLAFGLVVVAAGIVLMLRNTNLIDPFYAHMLISWPMLIIAFGFTKIFSKEFPFGIILMLAGGIFLASKFYGLPVSIAQILWPALIILFGLFVIIGSRVIFKGGWHHSHVYDDSFIEEVAVFSGSEHVVNSPEFKGGKFVCVFGGSKVNLLQTNISPQGANIELIAVFGGLSLIVPSDWTVKLEVVSIFGGFADKRIITAASPDKKLFVKGVCIFGGGDIKSIPD